MNPSELQYRLGLRILICLLNRISFLFSNISESRAAEPIRLKAAASDKTPKSWPERVCKTLSLTGSFLLNQHYWSPS